ncbi:MAG TPA: hypothetical protein VGV89_01130 [Thermoplasmata archaeon]|nr:hypothetical protein [Thermoplasmata archaeon]
MRAGWTACVLAALSLLGSTIGTVHGGAPPQLPVETARGFLPSLSVAPGTPGSSVTFGFALANPLAATLSNATLTLAFYGFNPYPGTGRVPLPTPAPSFVAGRLAGTSVSLAVGTVPPGTTGWNYPVSISIPDGTANGAYSIRDALSFDLNGSRYLLESVGNFAPSVWYNATVLANGTPTLNLTRLGVSGVLPETGLVVQSPGAVDDALYATLGVGGVLLVAGAYVALRGRGPSSRSGASSAPEDSHAPSALGNSRSNDGD